MFAVTVLQRGSLNDHRDGLAALNSVKLGLAGLEVLLNLGQPHLRDLDHSEIVLDQSATLRDILCRLEFVTGKHPDLYICIHL